MSVEFLNEFIKANDLTNVAVNCAIPGVIVMSSIMGHLYDPNHWLLYQMSLVVEKLFAKTTDQGAATSVFAALCPKLDGISGKIFEDCTDSKSDSKFAMSASIKAELQQWSEHTLTQNAFL